MTTAGPKKLTDPPKDFKEAIDWVIKINDHTQDLTTALDTLLNNDLGDVAVRVKGVYEGICEKFCNGCENGSTPDRILKYYLKNFETFEPVRRSGDETDEKMLKRLKGESESLKASLSQLPENLKKFLGWKESSFDNSGIIKNSGTSSYTFAYQNAEWKSEEATECAVILLIVAPMLFFGLVYLYWQCAPGSGSSAPSISWSGQSLSTDNALKKYMEALGYKENLNGKTGQNIVGLIEKMFSGELSSDAASSKTYPNFFGKLHKKTVNSSPPSPSSPLTSLYLISYYYISYPLHDVQSSSPANPSFLGYSGPAALAGGAYGFNIGGLGTFVSALLA
ncbi:uncharacterized protein BcabD6B2_48040 [Babesia caballi]|uniref:Uncharacterized protein n=1 Tax=Babesia caballi TaxID=5871 RepID=A0AAV4M3G5_BABCB|nr:hypothetical protein, conserved [Babesia caballi]